MVREALAVARGPGISEALLTCGTDNVASRRVIERNGGVLQDRHDDKWRFWLPAA